MSETTLDRAPLLRRALGLEYLTIGWNVLEGVVAVAAASAASSIALLGFGVDSFVECASGLVLVWRLRTRDVLGGGARSAPPLLLARRTPARPTIGTGSSSRRSRSGCFRDE